MKTVVRLLYAALLAQSACGGTDNPQPGTPTVVENANGTIAFTPSVVDATRFPMGCGVPNPPFADGDLFSLNVIGNKALAPYNAIHITFNSPASVGTPLTLAVQPFSPQGTGIGMPDGGTTWYAAQSAQGSGVSLSYSQGSDPSEIDTGAFDSVTVTIVAMPAKDGDPLTLRVQIHFVDGQTLDDTFSGALVSSWSGCPAG